MATTKTRPLLQRLAALGVRAQRPAATLRARCFSHKAGDGDDGDDEREAATTGVNGAENPFERLLQHSQQFRQQMAEQQGWPLADDRSVREELLVEQEEEDAQDEPDSSSSSSSSSSSDGEEEDASRASRRSKRNDRRATRTLHERDQRAVRAERNVKRRVLHAPDDALDYEHGLSSPQHAVAKERKYQQLIHREQDKDRVCRNCGERGHVAKYCLLPLICSNCGGVGHRVRDCIYPDYTAGDSDDHQAQQTQEHVAEKLRMGKRFIRFKEDFDAEIEDFLERSASRTEKQRKRSAEKEAAKQQTKKKQDEPSQEFKPVIG